MGEILQQDNRQHAGTGSALLTDGAGRFPTAECDDKCGTIVAFLLLKMPSERPHDL